MAVGSKILQNTLARAKYGRRGKVHYNGQRAKPSKSVEIGAQITLRQGHDEKTVIIEKISDQRRGAPEAQQLYRETAESITKRERNAMMRQLNRVRIDVLTRNSAEIYSNSSISK